MDVLNAGESVLYRPTESSRTECVDDWTSRQYPLTTRKVIASLVYDRSASKVRSSPLTFLTNYIIRSTGWSLTISEPRAARPSSLFLVILSHYLV